MSATAPLDERYLDWLYSLVAPVTSRNPARSYRLLLEHLFKRQFRWSIANDDNRIEDARELRFDFLDRHEITHDDLYWIELDASVLEVLMSLSQRAAFQSSETPEFWFWKFLENLRLSMYTDEVYRRGEWENIDEILNKFIDRTYRASGYGGLFPLRHPKEDQRKVEIWYQMAAYLIENGYVT